MMLADPRRIEAELVGIKRLVEDVGDKAVRIAPVVGVVVVAQREITELHRRSPDLGSPEAAMPTLSTGSRRRRILGAARPTSKGRVRKARIIARFYRWLVDVIHGNIGTIYPAKSQERAH